MALRFMNRPCGSSAAAAARERMRKLGAALLAVAATLLLAADRPRSQDAVAAPEADLPTIWTHRVGPGYAAIAVRGQRLYVHHHETRGDTSFEIVAALDRRSGDEIWRHAYPESFQGAGFGPGPNATPVVARSRLFAVGLGGKLHAFDRSRGRLLWSHDLVAEFGAEVPLHGYSSTPLAHRSLLILPLGGPTGPGAVAFRQQDGSVAWTSGSFGLGYSSPALIRVGGEAQVVLYLPAEIVALDPATGAVRWSVPHRGPMLASIAMTPIWDQGRGILFTAAYDVPERGGGGRALRVGAGADVEELWHDADGQVPMVANPVKMGRIVLNSVKGRRLAALDIDTGRHLWEVQGYRSAKLLTLRDRLLMLEENGRLTLGAAGATGFEVLRQTHIETARAWTRPLLEGSTLYFRDRERVAAFDLTRWLGAGFPAEMRD